MLYTYQINQFNKLDIPLSVAIIDMDWHITDIPKEYGSGWTGYTWNKELFPNPKETLKWFHKNDLQVGLNLHPALGIRPHEDAYEKVATRLGLNPKDKKKPKSKRGRYLPKSVRAGLTKGQKAYENRKKRRATKSGKTRARYSKSVRRKMRGK